MFKGPFDVRELTVHDDIRGNLFEILRFKDDEVPAGGYIYSFSVTPGSRRGDHYHEHKHEWLSCVSGELVVLVQVGNDTPVRIPLAASRPSVVYFAPGTAHAILNESVEPAVAICYGSAQHDPSNPDTIRKVVSYEGIQ